MSGTHLKSVRNPSADQSAEQPILYQQFFKSVGSRTYVAQVKKARNGNHFLVLTEGRRDATSDEVRKTRLYVFSEDFPEFFRLLHETAQFIKANPVSDEVKRRRQQFRQKRRSGADRPGETQPRRHQGGGSRRVVAQPSRAAAVR
jgi:hypothetical protein